MELSELIEAVDIVEYISQYVELTEKNGEYWGLSCFKDERTPSFSVRQNPPCFFDYSSGIGGNVFTFIRYYNRCSKDEALDILKKYVGDEEGSVNVRKKMTATKVCKRFLPPKQNNKPANIQTFPDDCMDKYEKRADKLAVWENEGISKQSLDKFNVCYDSFSDRLVYPVKDTHGKIVNIGGRTLDRDWKEKGLRKYTYFAKWGSLNVIYGLFDNMQSILEKKEIILFEGAKSVLLADTWGIHNTGAILTSHLNPNQLKILAKLGVRVVFALDKDVRVRDDHNINKLKKFVNVEYIWDFKDLLDEKDAPVDKGKEVFETLYSQRLKFK